MYPDLSYFLHDFIGTPRDNWSAIFQTFGLLLVFAIFCSGLLLYVELKRKAKDGIFQPELVTIQKPWQNLMVDLLSNAFLGFLIGFKLGFIILNFELFKTDATLVLLTLKGSWFFGVISALLLAALRYYLEPQTDWGQPRTVEYYPHDRVGEITVIAGLAGIIGAKLFDIIEHLPTFILDPVGVLFSGGGLAIYGGLITGFIAVYFYLKKRGIPPIHVMDAVAPALIFGYGIGRLGCHFSGDGDWGIANNSAPPSWWFLPEWLWSYDYPHNYLKLNSPIPGCEAEFCYHLVPAVYPTPLYETSMALLIFGILWYLRKRLVIPGMLFFLYLIFSGIERYLIEKIRINKDYEWLGMVFTQAELISLISIFIGMIGVIYLYRKNSLRET